MAYFCASILDVLVYFAQVDGFLLEIDSLFFERSAQLWNIYISNRDLVSHGYGRSGVPDIIACVSGHFMAVECKAGTNKPTLLQVREIERIRRSGGVALVVNEENWDMVRQLIRQLRDGTIIEDNA